jgi:predicted dehydrogenase
MRNPLRMALVGTGGIAKAYAEALAGLEDVKLVAACDTDIEAVTAFAAATACMPYVNFDDMLAGGEFQAIVVCTPPATHEALALAAIERGCHVLCEKPLTTSVASARRIVAAAAERNVVLTMASKFRFVDDVRQARELVTGGEIGDLVLIENAFTSRVDMSRRWNSNPILSGGGVLIDNGTHAVDLLRFFMGQLCDVQIFEGRRIQSVAVEDTVRIFVRNAYGAIGTADLSWSINKELDHYVRLYGSDGTILIGWKESRYKRFDDARWISFGSGYDKVSAFRKQIQNFADAVAGHGTVELTTDDAIASVEVIAAGYAAMSASHWHNVRFSLDELAPPANLEAVS